MIMKEVILLMIKQILLYSFTGLLLLLLLVNLYMFFSLDANFSLYYSLSSFIIICIIIILVIFAFTPNKAVVIIALIVIFVNYFMFKFVFMGSIEKFLFIKNKEFYMETVNMIIKKNMSGYIDLRGKYKKLSRNNLTNVYREGNHLEIYFGIFSSPSSRGQIVFTNNMEKLLNQNNMGYVKYEVLDKNWCILYF